MTKTYKKTSEPCSHNTIVDALHRIYQDFSKQEKRVADVILDALYARADAAMYLAKRQGKNQIVLG